MKKIVEKWNNASTYVKSFIVFTVFLCICGCGLLGYVHHSLVVYDQNLIDHYIVDYFKNGKVIDDVDGDLFDVSKLENEKVSMKEGLQELFEQGEVKLKKDGKKSTEDVFAYDVIVNGQPFSSIFLESKESYTQMVILKINQWEVKDVEMKCDRGFFNYEVTIPANYQLVINDQVVNDDYVSEIRDVEGLERVTQYVSVHETKTYQMDGFVKEPQIKIMDDKNQEVEYTTDSNKIVVQDVKFEEIEDYETAKKKIKGDFDILSLARNWSLVLTNDLGGPEHGFYKLAPYLLEDSYMYDMAYGWTHQVDITFVSEHSLKNPPFTNQKVSNFVFYNDKAFSCEVYLEKNMTLFYGSKVDVMHDRLYFVYVDGGYKLVDMKSI